jgi:hypothetical protein
MGVGDPGVTGTLFTVEGVAATPGITPAPRSILQRCQRYHGLRRRCHLQPNDMRSSRCIEPPAPPPPPALGAVAASPGLFTGETTHDEDLRNSKEPPEPPPGVPPAARGEAHLPAFGPVAFHEVFGLQV